MRVILAAAATLAVITVSGCDINTGPAAPAARVECHCAGAPPAGMRGSTAAAPPAETYHHGWHHERHGTGYASWHGGGHSYRWHREYAERSVVTYDYHSTSHSYYLDGGEGGGSSSGGDAYAYAGAYGGGSAYAGAHGDGYSDHHGDGYHTVPRGWVDGYGRAHESGADAYDGPPAHGASHADGPHRGDPWHGYDVDCPDAPRH